MFACGIHSGRRHKEHDVVENPAWPITLAYNSKTAESKKYPMKFLEMNLSNKCNGFRLERGVSGSSFVRRLTQKGEDCMCWSIKIVKICKLWDACVWGCMT